MFEIDFEPFYLSLKLAFITTALLFILVLPLAYFMSQKRFIFKPILEAIISLPLVLPPSVLGFYMLIILSPYSPLGAFIKDIFNVKLVFNFTGLLIASCIYSLPFMFSPIYAGFCALRKSIFEASASLGKGKFSTMMRVALPNIKPNLLTALVVSFAHTMGEFGVVLMIGGSIKGETKVASIAIFEAMEELDFAKAHIYAGLMLIMSFAVLAVVHILNSKRAKFG